MAGVKGGTLLPAPTEIYGTGIDLVEDIVQDFLLFKSRRKIIVTQGGFDLSDYIAYIGHGLFKPPFLLVHHEEARVI
jgi:hypothetical protein